MNVCQLPLFYFKYESLFRYLLPVDQLPETAQNTEDACIVTAVRYLKILLPLEHFSRVYRQYREIVDPLYKNSGFKVDIEYHPGNILPKLSREIATSDSRTIYILVIISSEDHILILDQHSSGSVSLIQSYIRVTGYSGTSIDRINVSRDTMVDLLSQLTTIFQPVTDKFLWTRNHYITWFNVFGIKYTDSMLNQLLINKKPEAPRCAYLTYLVDSAC